MKRFACALLLLLACTRKPSRPVLSVFEDASARAGETAELDPRALALALGAMRPEAREELRERLTAAADDELKRANPLIVDLEEPDAGSAPRDRLATSLKVAIPAATAALNLLGSPWRAPGLRVELGDSCAPNAKLCARVLDASIDRRAGFAAWAWADAVACHVDDNVLEKLRASAEDAGSTIALVLSQSRGELDGVELAALRHQAERALPRLEPDTAAGHWLQALAHLPRDFSVPLQFSAGEAVVVPRLSALAKLEQFDAELRKCGAVPEQ